MLKTSYKEFILPRTKDVTGTIRSEAYKMLATVLETYKTQSVKDICKSLGTSDRDLTSVISQVLNDVAKECQQHALTIGHTYIEILVGDTS